MLQVIRKTTDEADIIEVHMQDTDAGVDCMMRVQLESGLCADRGKFESEPPFTMYYWELYMNGAGGEEFTLASGELANVYEIKEQDVVVFPELKGQKYVMIWESESGFVNHAWFDSDAALQKCYDLHGKGDEDGGS